MERGPSWIVAVRFVLDGGNTGKNKDNGLLNGQSQAGNNNL